MQCIRENRKKVQKNFAFACFSKNKNISFCADGSVPIIFSNALLWKLKNFENFCSIKTSCYTALPCEFQCPNNIYIFNLEDVFPNSTKDTIQLYLATGFLVMLSWYHRIHFFIRFRGFSVILSRYYGNIMTNEELTSGKIFL